MTAIGRRPDANMDQVIALGVSVGGGTVLSLRGAHRPASRR